MKQKPFGQRVGDMMEGKGFYIVLFLCVAAIGISGYYLFSGLLSSQPLSADQQTPIQQVVGESQVQVPSSSRGTPVPGQDQDAVTPPASTDGAASNQTPETNQEKQQPAKTTVFTWPVRGTLSREFSLEVFAYDSTMGDWRTHSGLDLETDVGTQVIAAGSGTVSAVAEDPLMGTMVVIDHGEGLESLYANLAEQPSVKVGDVITTGTVIGAVGNTALAESASAAHLHFEMKQDGLAVDPVSYFPKAE